MGMSVHTRLLRASEISRSLGIKNEEIVSVSVGGSGGIDFHLRPEGFLRVLQCLRPAKSKVKCSVSVQGDHHYRFESRSVVFCCVLLADKELNQSSLLESINATWSPPRLAASVPRLPAPVGATS